MNSIYENHIVRDCQGWTITSPLVAGLPSIEPRKPWTAEPGLGDVVANMRAGVLAFPRSHFFDNKKPMPEERNQLSGRILTCFDTTPYLGFAL